MRTPSIRNAPRYADAPVLVVDYSKLSTQSVGMAFEDCYGAYRWLRLRGYEPDQIVLAGDGARGYLALALAQRLKKEGEEPAAMVVISPVFEISNGARADHPNIRAGTVFAPRALGVLAERIEAAAKRTITCGKRHQQSASS